jgi:glycine/D-amino acid oxidase-like deaminating enzyme
LWDADGTALVDPARLVWGLEKVCLKLGVKIYENSKVEWLERTSDGILVHTAYGSVYADKVALATNVFKSLIKRVRKYVIPVYDFQVVTEPLTPEQWKSIPLLSRHFRRCNFVGWL